MIVDLIEKIIWVRVSNMKALLKLLLTNRSRTWLQIPIYAVN